MADNTRVNNQITAPEVFLIDSDGSQRGVTVLHEALSAAQRERLDLVEVAANANPPVCRIMDHKRHQAERKRLLAEHRRLDGDEPGDEERGEDEPGGAGDRAPRRPLGPSPSSGQALDPLQEER